MCEIKIDKGIPFPPDKRGLSLPFEEMEIGDSFFVSMAQNLMSGHVRDAKKRTKHFYTTRAITENGVAGVRVWRTA